jgi:hypothetical protein
MDGVSFTEDEMPWGAMGNHETHEAVVQWPDERVRCHDVMVPAVLPDGNGGLRPCPELLTEEELILFLRIPEVSKAKDHHHVIENLKRMHDLPCLHICKKPLYPTEAVRRWVLEKTSKERR